MLLDYQFIFAMYIVPGFYLALEYTGYAAATGYMLLILAGLLIFLASNKNNSKLQSFLRMLF